jgi:hypothetical protein
LAEAVGDCVLRRLDQGTLRQLAELADAFARVRARHTLLLDVVPSRCEKAIPSVEVVHGGALRSDGKL